MNKRIKELISQSYEYSTITTIDPFTQEVVTDYIDCTKPIFNKEKFAELIVRECVEICNQAILQNQDTLSKLNEDELAEKMAIHGAILQAQKLSNGINEHFGVDCYTQEDLDQAHERGIELANKLRVE
jgi:2,3-bisphosphoglycerate-independent phosphoglycerate mutase